MKKILLLILVLITGFGFAQNNFQNILDSLETELSKATTDSLKLHYLKILGYDYALYSNEKNINFNLKAIELSKKINYPMGIANAYINLGLYYERQNDTLKQKEYLGKALELADKTKDDNISGKVHYEMALYCWARNSRIKTEYNFLKAIDFFTKSKNKSDLSDVLIQFGYYYSTIKDYNNALKYYRKYADFFEKDDIELTDAYAVIIDLYITQSKYDKALEYCKLSEELFKKNNRTNGNFYAYLQNNFGIIYKIKKQYDKSLESYNTALNYFIKVENYWESALVYASIASVFQELQQNDKVFENINTAVEIIKKANSCRYSETVYTKIGYIYFEIEDYQRALEFHLMAYRECSLNEPYKDVSTQEYNIGVTYLQLARNINQITSESTDIPKNKNKLLQFGEQYLNKTIEEAKTKADISILKDSYLKLSDIADLQNQKNKAFEYYKQHIVYKDSLKSIENRELLVQNQMQFEFDQQEKIRLVEQEAKDALTREELAKEKSRRNMALAGVGIFVVLAGFSGFAYSQKHKDNKIIAREKQKSDDLLLNILPEEVANELKEKGTSDAKHFESVSIMFTDFKDFTKLSEKIPSKELIEELNYCFKAFDEIVAKHGVEKIKTIGDSYMAVCGLPAQHGNHAQKMVQTALEIRDFIEDYKIKRQKEGKSFFEMRIGINSGEVVAGIVGIKKFAYDIWGDAVNTASRMESNGEIGKVNISESTYNLVKNDFDFQYRGEIETKGKGEIKMYFVENKKV